MAIQPINTLKNWFKTGLKPTQQQFWDWLDSFRHKSEKIPVADVEGIDELLAGINPKPIYKVGELLIFKRGENANNYIETGDLAIGIVESVFITGVYLGREALLENFNIINQIDF